MCFFQRDYEPRMRMKIDSELESGKINSEEAIIRRTELSEIEQVLVSWVQQKKNKI